MNITPVLTSANTVGAIEGSGGVYPRTLQMKTNVTRTSFPKELSIPPTNETPEAQEAIRPLSAQQAEMARTRRARALEAKERALAEREMALKSQMESMPSKDAVPLSRIKSETLNVLLEAGVSYDDLTKAILANQGDPEVRALKSELEALKAGVDKKFVDQETEQRKQILSEMRREASLLASQSENFALVKETRSIPDVMSLIEKTYDSTGEVLEVSEAMGLVEAELLKDAERLAKIEKVKNRFMQQPPLVQPQQRPQMTTLTNKHTASAQMSARDRALAAFYGTLKR